MRTKIIDPNEVAVPFETHRRLRPLAVLDQLVYASRGLSLYELSGTGDRRRLLDGGTTARSLLSRLWYVERILRAEIHSMNFRSDGSALLVVNGAVICLDLQLNSMRGRFVIPGASRPLRVENTPDGKSYFGIYSTNRQRNAVPVYATEDGVHWETAYEFPASSIRHIHGIFYDHLRKGLWVLTGDDGDEAGLWFTDNHFKDLTPVSRGTQQSRAVTVFPVESGLIVPMDTPQEQNYINHYDIERDRYETLVSIPGSSLASTRDGDCMLISTAVERSAVNLDQRTSVFGSIDGENWSVIARLNRDWRITRKMRPYLQHPTIRFAHSDGSMDRIFASCMAVKGLDGTMISWCRKELMNYLREGR